MFGCRGGKKNSNQGQQKSDQTNFENGGPSGRCAIIASDDTHSISSEVMVEMYERRFSKEFSSIFKLKSVRKMFAKRRPSIPKDGAIVAALDTYFHMTKIGFTLAGSNDYSGAGEENQEYESTDCAGTSAMVGPALEKQESLSLEQGSDTTTEPDDSDRKDSSTDHTRMETDSDDSRFAKKGIKNKFSFAYIRRLFKK